MLDFFFSEKKEPVLKILILIILNCVYFYEYVRERADSDGGQKVVTTSLRDGDTGACVTVCVPGMEVRFCAKSVLALNCEAPLLQAFRALRLALEPNLLALVP